jgi:hypothetical protein
MPANLHSVLRKKGRPGAAKRRGKMAKPSMTGIWRGEILNLPYTLDLTQLSSHVSGLLTVGGFKKTGSVIGVNYYPVVLLSGSFLRHGAHFHGQFVDENTIKGTIKAAGNAGEITFRRDISVS